MARHSFLMRQRGDKRAREFYLLKIKPEIVRDCLKVVTRALLSFFTTVFTCSLYLFTVIIFIIGFNDHGNYCCVEHVMAYVCTLPEL